MSAPTQISTGLFGAVNWFNAATPKTATPAVQAGDLIVVLGATEDFTAQLATPTGGTGITWTQHEASSTSNRANAYVWTGQVTTTETPTISIARSAGSGQWNARYYVVRNHGGANDSTLATANTGTPTLDLVITGVDAMIFAIIADWAALNNTATWTAINGVSGISDDDTGNTTNYGVHTHVFSGVGSAATRTVASSTTGYTWTLAAIAVLGVAGPAYDEMTWAVGVTRG